MNAIEISDYFHTLNEIDELALILKSDIVHGTLECKPGRLQPVYKWRTKTNTESNHGDWNCDCGSVLIQMINDVVSTMDRWPLHETTHKISALLVSKYGFSIFWYSEHLQPATECKVDFTFYIGPNGCDYIKIDDVFLNLEWLK